MKKLLLYCTKKYKNFYLTKIYPKLFKSFQITSLLILLVSVLPLTDVFSQTTAVVGGITITTSGSRQTAYAAPNPSTNAGCPTSPFTGLGSYTGSDLTTGSTGTVTYTFSAPVKSVRVSYTLINSAGTPGQTDAGTLSTNTGGALTLSDPCGVSVSGSVLTGNGAGMNYGDVYITVTAATSFTTLKVTNTGARSGWVQGNPTDFIIYQCNAGTVAPTLSATTKSNVCPSTTADISTLVSSTCPVGSNLEWHDVSTGFSAPNLVANAATVGAGTYYPVCYDASNTCYSPAPATGVTVSITTCTPPFTIVQPAAVTKSASTPITGITPTDVSPTGGTGPYIYTNGSADPSCVAPVGATALPATSNLIVNADGTFTYTTPATTGTYYFCIKVCDSAAPPVCAIATYKVTVSAGCTVGSAVPVLKN